MLLTSLENEKFELPVNKLGVGGGNKKKEEEEEN